MTLDSNTLRHIVQTALTEDVGQGDITSKLTIPGDAAATIQITAREGLVVCGLDVLDMVYAGCLGLKTPVSLHVQDGNIVEAGTTLAEIKGNARMLLTGERVALNLMQRMSGVATLTQRYVDAVAGTKAVILDTRKTMPGLRALDKYAVTVGGGQNHRMRLDDMVLIKDNHIAVCGSISKAVKQARSHCNLPVEVECDTLEQIQEALEVMPDRIMLDNMDTDTLSKAVALVTGKVKLEASGGINLDTVRAIAQTGVDYISVGALTHSTPAVDIGADIVIEN